VRLDTALTASDERGLGPFPKSDNSATCLATSGARGPLASTVLHGGHRFEEPGSQDPSLLRTECFPCDCVKRGMSYARRVLLIALLSGAASVGALWPWIGPSSLLVAPFVSSATVIGFVVIVAFGAALGASPTLGEDRE
jgi:hypothetical protein